MSSADSLPGGAAPDPDSWGQPISDERQAELRARLQTWAQETDHGTRRGPFDGISLTGADVFWLAEHLAEYLEPVSILDPVNLPLEGAFLGDATLTSADLSRADLTSANLGDATLTSADLSYATLTSADLSYATLTSADLSFATLTSADLLGADLNGANLRSANLRSAYLGDATLTSADLLGATLTSADLNGADLSRADLSRVDLNGANLSRATLNGADLSRATLDHANLSRATLTSANLSRATLIGADLSASRMDASTRLEEATLDQQTQVADVVWNNVPLTRVAWSKVPRLGDEDAITKAKTRDDRIAALRVAVRAYHGLATALRAQGLAEATTYRLREQRLLRWQQRLERKYGGWVLSGLLDLISGYGEAPGRIFVAYLVVVLSFAAAYFGITNFGGSVLVSHSDPLKWYEAIVLSLSSFHGRGFFPQTINLGDPVAVVAALEAVFGLFIELILIATFSKRFLGD